METQLDHHALELEKSQLDNDIKRNQDQDLKYQFIQRELDRGNTFCLHFHEHKIDVRKLKIRKAQVWKDNLENTNFIHFYQLNTLRTLLDNSNLIIWASVIPLYVIAFLSIFMPNFLQPADVFPSGTNQQTESGIFNQIMEYIFNPFTYINNQIIYIFLNYYLYTLVLAGLVVKVMYNASRIIMPFSEDVNEETRKEISQWARRIEIRGLKFGEDFPAVVNFLNKIQYSDEKKGPGNIKWQQIYDLDRLDEKYFIYNLLKFLENEGREVLDPELDALKRRLLDSIWETFDDVLNQLRDRKSLKSFCSDYTMVTFPTVQSAQNFREIFKKKNKNYLENTLGTEVYKKLSVFHPYCAFDIDWKNFTHSNTLPKRDGTEQIYDYRFQSRNRSPFEFLFYWLRYPANVPSLTLIIAPALTYIYFYFPQAIVSELLFQPSGSSYNPKTLPASILVVENSFFFFLFRMLLTLLYIMMSYLFVFPFIEKRMPIKRSYFSQQRQRLAFMMLYFGLNIGLCMVWAHETACVTSIDGYYYGVKRPVKIANLNIKGVNWAVFSAGFCASSLPFLGTQRVRNFFSNYFSSSSIWPENMRKLVKFENFRALKNRKKLTPREVRSKQVQKSIREELGVKAETEWFASYMTMKYFFLGYTMGRMAPFPFILSMISERFFSILWTGNWNLEGYIIKQGLGTEQIAYIREMLFYPAVGLLGGRLISILGNFNFEP